VSWRSLSSKRCIRKRTKSLLYLWIYAIVVTKSVVKTLCWRPSRSEFIPAKNNKFIWPGPKARVRWVSNQSLATMSHIYKQTGKGIGALTMNKQIPVWKKEHEWLKECYSQCLQSSTLNLSIAFINLFDGLAGYPTFKKRLGRQ
jgi:hypothetical protein